MNDVKIIINGEEFPIHYQMLYEIARNFPCGKQYADLEKALIALNIPSITQEIISNDHHLTTEATDEIWQNGDTDIRLALLDSTEFIETLNDNQAKDILAADDDKMLKLLASSSELLIFAPDNKTGRLSIEMANALIDRITQSQNNDILNALWMDSATPSEFLPSFQEYYKRSNGCLNYKIINRIKSKDIPFIAGCPGDFLKNLADCVDDIESRKARIELCKLLASHPEPAVRLALAENHFAPHFALSILASDPDPDIAHAAEDSLPGADDEDEATAKSLE